MTDPAGTLNFESLPRTVPLFPLAGVLLLPGGRLPLNIFEERYLAMTRDAMAGSRLIGMVQPRQPDDDQASPQIYRIGCAGRVTSFNETEDGRFLIVVTGLCRFYVVEELSATTPYRQALVSFGRFRDDMEGGEAEDVDSQRLIAGLRAYLESREIKVDWKAVGANPSPTVINALAMVCPFEPSEKQAILEAADFAERCRIIMALAEMALLEQGRGSGTPLQ
jgi:hypothetical protein